MGLLQIYDCRNGSEIMEDKDMIKMYDLVFRDMVRCYLEDDYLDIDRDKVDESIIREVAYDLIYKSEYLWETINEHIETYLEKYLEEEND